MMNLIGKIIPFFSSSNLEIFEDQLQSEIFDARCLDIGEARTVQNARLFLEKFLEANPKIKNKVLNLNGMQLGINCIIALNRNLLGRNIEVLNLASNQISDNGMNAVKNIINSTLIKHINLSSNMIGDFGLEILLDDLIKNNQLKSVESLSKDIAIIRNSFFHLESLDIGNNNITSKICDILKVFLESSQTICKINLENNKISIDGAKFIASGLKNSKTLISLNLRGNSIRDEGLDYIADALFYNRILEELDISLNEITSNGISILAETLPQSNIKYLNISENPLNDVSLIKLANSFQQFKDLKLEKIDFSSCKIGEEGLTHFLEKTKNFQNLKKIKSYNNYISDLIVQRFVEAKSYKRILELTPKPPEKEILNSCFSSKDSITSDPDQMSMSIFSNILEIMAHLKHNKKEYFLKTILTYVEEGIEKNKIGITLQEIMNNFQINLKKDLLEKFLNRLKKVTESIPPPPLSNSIIMENNNSEILQENNSSSQFLELQDAKACLTSTNKEFIRILKENNVPYQFLEMTETSEMKEILRQIENITGCDLNTGFQTDMIKLKIDSPDLNKSKIVENNEQQIREALIQDIAFAFDTSKYKVSIRHVVKGSIEVLFSLPEGNQNPALDSSNLNHLTELLKKNGISNINASQIPVASDIKKAKEILENYTRPVIIETKENGSILMEKFGKYIHLLACLSSRVRVVHNPGTKSLEIHGPPSAKSEVLAFFASIEDQLQNLNDLKVELIPHDHALLTENYYAPLWNFLYEEAKKFSLSTYVNTNYPLQTHTLQKNSYLENGSPSGKSFIAALNKINLNPSLPQNVFAAGTFGWHGTNSDENLLNILYDNLDRKRRNTNGQCYGPGEYCAKNPAYSQGSSWRNGYWGNTKTLLLFFILEKNNPYYSFKTHFVINNPSEKEMYMVPILIATFSNRTSSLELNPKKEPDDFSWQWLDDSGWTKYGKGQINIFSSQITIEEMFKKYSVNVKAATGFTLRFVRLNNKKEDDYIIDFETMKQINVRTKYNRKIRRIEI